GGNGNDSLFGAAGIDSLSGGSGNDTIVGGAGDDAQSGSRGNDLFVFGDDFGHDQISDFKPGEDDIHFAAGIFTNFADLMDHAVQVGLHVVITTDDGDSLQLNNLQRSSLQSADFL